MSTQRGSSDGKPKNLSDLAYSAIRLDILSCELEPSLEITENQLVERYHFGKAPVRAALHRLRQEGLVVPLPRRGYVVAPITMRDVKEIFEVRLIIEPVAVRMAAGRVDPEHLAELDKVLAAGYTPGDRASEAAFLEGNRQIHVAIAACSGNQRLTSILERILGESGRVLHLGLAAGDRSQEFRHEHHELIAALSDGDGDRAEELAREAIVGAQRMVMAALLGSPTLLDVELGQGA